MVRNQSDRAYSPLPTFTTRLYPNIEQVKFLLEICKLQIHGTIEVTTQVKPRGELHQGASGYTSSIEKETWAVDITRAQNGSFEFLCPRDAQVPR